MLLIEGGLLNWMVHGSGSISLPRSFGDAALRDDWCDAEAAARLPRSCEVAEADVVIVFCKVKIRSTSSA